MSRKNESSRESFSFVFSFPLLLISKLNIPNEFRIEMKQFLLFKCLYFLRLGEAGHIPAFMMNIMRYLRVN